MTIETAGASSAELMHDGLTAADRGTEGHPAIDVSDNIRRLVPYVPGKPIEEVQRELGISDIVKLASNENALGPAPKAVAAMRELATRMHVYPDAGSTALRAALSERLGVSPSSLVFGNGSDDLIHLLGITFLRPGDEVIQAWPSFVRYEAAAILNEAPCHRVPLAADGGYDVDAMSALVGPSTRLVFFSNPNNPTGAIIRQAELERFLGSVPQRCMVVLDEAYYEYAAGAPGYPNGAELARADRNVVVLRTFSKAYGLAGLRIGYGIMRPQIARWLEQTREPFNVNAMAQAVAAAALEDAEHVTRTVAMNEAGKRAFYAAFSALGMPYTPSYGNFVWVDVGSDCKAVFQALLCRGVITRTGDVFDAPTHLRVTIGTEGENARFLSALNEVLGGAA